MNVVPVYKILGRLRQMLRGGDTLKVVTDVTAPAVELREFYGRVLLCRAILSGLGQAARLLHHLREFAQF